MEVGGFDPKVDGSVLLCNIPYICNSVGFYYCVAAAFTVIF